MDAILSWFGVLVAIFAIVVGLIWFVGGIVGYGLILIVFYRLVGRMKVLGKMYE